MSRFASPADAGAHRALPVVAFALAAGAVLRLALLWWVGSLEPRIVDEQHYIELARSLYEGRGFAWATGAATSIRPPLYPAFVAGIWTLVGGPSLLAVRIAQMLLALGTVWLIYRLGTAMFEARVGALAAVGVALYPSLLFANVTLLTETLFTFLLALTVWLLHLALRDEAPGWSALSGVCCGLAALTRSVLWPFPVLAALLIVAISRGPWVRRIGLAAAFCICHALVLTPWAVRNTRVQGVFSVVDTMSGFNLWMANSDATPAERMWDAVGQGGQERFSEAVTVAFPGGNPTEGEKDRWGRSAALRYMLSHPVVTIERSLRKFADFWGLDRELVASLLHGLYSPTRLASAAMTAAVLLPYPLVMILAALGIWYAPKRSWPTHAVVATVILFLCLIHSLVFGHSRYRLPLMPFLMIYSAAGVLAVQWAALPVRRWRLAGAVAMIAVLAVVWIQEIAVRDLAQVRALFERLVP